MALDATAGKLYPNTRTGHRFIKFVDEHCKFITGFSFHTLVVYNKLILGSRPDRKSATGTSPITLGNCLYDIRNHRIHESELPEGVVFDEHCMGGGKPFRLIRSMPIGIVAAVVGAHVNRNEQMPLGYSFVVGERRALIADYAGQATALWDWFESARDALIASEEYKKLSQSRNASQVGQAPRA